MTSPPRLRRSFVPLFLALLSIVIAPAGAATIYVDVANMSGIELGTQTYPYRSIQAGINVTMSANDVVSVAPGTYMEAILVRDGVDVICAAPLSCTIDATVKPSL